MKYVLVAVFGIVAACAASAIYWLAAFPFSFGPTEPTIEKTVKIGRYERHFIVYVPPGLKRGGSVLFVLHGSGMDGRAMRREVGSTFERLARLRGVVVVYPSGYEEHFNDCRAKAAYTARKLQIDDVAFIRSIVGQLVVNQKIDRGRVYAYGYSNGGQMALRLALEAPDLVAGVISNGANLPAPGNFACHSVTGRTPAVVLIEGTRDPINPYLGGSVQGFLISNRGKVLSAQASAIWFAHRAGFDSPTASRILEQRNGLVAREQDWGMAKTGVRLITIEGAGHTIPQSTYSAPRILGHTFLSDSVIESAWQFLEPRP